MLGRPSFAQGQFWALALLTFARNNLLVRSDQVDIPDDIYHCRDPDDVEIWESISCDPETYLWNVDELSAEEPPRMCRGQEFVLENLEELANVQDWFEPCVLWAMTYGDLKPTANPTASPTGK